jgi:hypothetical protein
MPLDPNAIQITRTDDDGFPLEARVPERWDRFTMRITLPELPADATGWGYFARDGKIHPIKTADSE